MGERAPATRDTAVGGSASTGHGGCLRLKMILTCGSHMSVVEGGSRHGHDRNFSWSCLSGVRCLHGKQLWRDTSAKGAILNGSSNKNGKSVGVILRMDFECLPVVIMANM
jgi:hypothetical protein